MLVCSTLASPAAQPNIKAYYQKTNEDLTRASTSENPFQNLVVLHETDVKLYRPSLQYVKELDCQNNEIIGLGRKIFDPQNDAIVGELWEEAAFLQERKEDIDDLLHIQCTQIQDTKNSLCKAESVCRYWKHEKVGSSKIVAKSD